MGYAKVFRLFIIGSLVSCADFPAFAPDLILTPTVVQETTVGRPVDFQSVTVTGGTLPFTYAVSPALPAGLTIDGSTGRVSGTPTAVAPNTTYSVSVTDANNVQKSAGFPLTVNDRPRTVPTPGRESVQCTAEAACRFTPVIISLGTPPYTYTISPALPPPMAINGTTGEITGTPATSFGPTEYTITVTDRAGSIATIKFTLRVNVKVTLPDPQPLRPCTRDIDCNFTPAVGSGGTPPLRYSATGLPSGLTINVVSGEIRGRASQVVRPPVTVTVTVTDSLGATASKQFQLEVNDDLGTELVHPSVVCTRNMRCRPQTPFTPVRASGGISPLDYAVAPSLPAGLTMDPLTGAITGTPTATQSRTAHKVTVTDKATPKASSDKSFDLTVNPTLVVTSQGARICAQFAPCIPFAPVTVTGGSLPLVYSLDAPLPPGLQLDPNTGVISGTPTTLAGPTTYTITVTDAADAAAATTFPLTVNAQPLVATLVIPAKTCVMGRVCTFTPVTATGGVPPRSFAVSPGLPSGLQLNTQNGEISGTATVSQGATPYTITVTDNNNQKDSKTFVLTLNQVLTVTPTAGFVTCNVNQFCSPRTAFNSVIATGGIGPYSYAINTALPAGLSFNPSNGAISGAATVIAATAPRTVTVTDGDNVSASTNFQLTVNPTLTMTTPGVSVLCVQNGACTPATPVTPLTPNGGTTPYAFSITPALPTGLSLNQNTGAISGTPTVAHNATTHTITVADGIGATATGTFLLTVTGQLVAATVVSPIVCTATFGCKPILPQKPVNASGGTQPYGYSATLPASLVMSSTTGIITGTPTVVFPTANVVVTVTHAGPPPTTPVTAPFSLTVNPALTTTQVVPSITCVVNAACTPTLPRTPVTASGGTPLLTFAINPGLPGGLTFNTANGSVGGSPSATHPTTTHTVTVTDDVGATSSKTFQLTVNATPPLQATLVHPTYGCTQNTACPFTPVTATGGTPPRTFSQIGLPAGLTMNSAGVISGMPTGTGTVQVTVTVTDAVNDTDSEQFTLTVNSAPSLSDWDSNSDIRCHYTTNTCIYSPQPAPSGPQTPNPFDPFVLSGGTGPFTYSLGTTLPAGFTFNTTTGKITIGTLPATNVAAANYLFTATDDRGAIATRTFTLWVVP